MAGGVRDGSGAVRAPAQPAPDRGRDAGHQQDSGSVSPYTINLFNSVQVISKFSWLH